MADHDNRAIDSTAPGHYGAAGIGLTLQEVTIAAAWNIQGDIGKPALAATVQRLFDVALPTIPNTMARGAALTAMWLGPGSWLLIGEAEPHDCDATRDALNAAGGALFDLSASRVAWRLAGRRVAEVLNKGCPLDLDPRIFGSGACAQSLFGHINILLCRNRDDASLLVMVARSFSSDAWHLICTSAAQYGYDVLPPAPAQ